MTDGDSIWINKNGKKTEVRLACIDAPEGKQFWEQQTTNRLAKISPLGQKIELRKIRLYEIFVAGQSVNLQMVQEGNTVVYLPYLNNCASNTNQYLQAEEYAKIQKLGFWNQQNPVMPWNFRQGKRSNQPTYSPFPVNTSNLLKNYNCPDFTTQAEAKEIFNKYPNDPFDLDRDHDDIACENLP
ncbi:MAG: thermonuclease family protein [Nostoc sp.]|uniref:thermonuclease family protein n=1 Tax=Nostoc sp. TaxID=1180 RepID=UPI002FFBF832